MIRGISLHSGVFYGLIILVDTQANLLSTQPKIEFEYTLTPYLFRKMTTDEVILVSVERIITFILNQFQKSDRSLELRYGCNIQQNSKKLHVGV